MQYNYMKFVSLLIGFFILGLEIYICERVSSETYTYKTFDGLMITLTIVSILECGFSIVVYENLQHCWELALHIVLVLMFLGSGLFVFITSKRIDKICKAILELHLEGTICGYLRVRFGIGALSLLNCVIYLIAIPKSPILESTLDETSTANSDHSESEPDPDTRRLSLVSFNLTRRLSETPEPLTAVTPSAPVLPNEPPQYSESELNPPYNPYEPPPPYSSVFPISMQAQATKNDEKFRPSQ